MPMLRNAKHEMFAQALAKGMDVDEAYVEAGYTHNRGNASRLKATENVKARVAELMGRAETGVVLTKQWVLEQLIDNAAEAKKAGQIAPANRALELLGKELGMFIDRKEVGAPGDFDMIEDPDELRRALAREAALAGFSAPAPAGEPGSSRGKPH